MGSFVLELICYLYRKRCALHHNVVDIQATLDAVESGDRSKEDRRRVVEGFHISAVINVIVSRLMSNAFNYTPHRSSPLSFVCRSRRRLIFDRCINTCHVSFLMAVESTVLARGEIGWLCEKSRDLHRPGEISECPMP